MGLLQSLRGPHFIAVICRLDRSSGFDGLQFSWSRTSLRYCDVLCTALR